MPEPTRTSARVIADSRHVAFGTRLTTMVWTFPRLILAEVNTHRQLSRNTASSRAIPTAKLIEAVRTDPFVPDAFGQNQRGMQAGEALSEWDQVRARNAWLEASARAAESAEALLALGAHKQHANRVLEPFLWTTSVVSATEWENFFGLRCDENAQPEIQALADAALAAYLGSTPEVLEPGDWHLPFSHGKPWQYDLPEAIVHAVSHCARVSYTTHDRQHTYLDAERLYNQLLENGHWSPFEHVARAEDERIASGNFRGGWEQLRHCYPHATLECDLVELGRARLGT
jgi:thymidylate synthase ThyX